MSESTRKKIIFALLVASMIWGYYNLDSEPKGAPQVAPAETTVSSVAVQPPVKSLPLPPQPANIEKKAEEPWGEDPFRVERNVRRTTQKSPQALSWRLSGILYNSQSPVAIINNRQVKPGDVVDEARVLKINRKDVILEYNGSKMTITVTKG